MKVSSLKFVYSRLADSRKSTLTQQASNVACSEPSASTPADILKVLLETIISELYTPCKMQDNCCAMNCQLLCFLYTAGFDFTES